jgi:putative oxidoreductase
MQFSFALLVLRVVVGAYLFGHGTQKLFGWFGGPGLKASIQGMGSMMGFRPAALWTVTGALAETFGGILVLLGFLSPIGPLAIVAAMLVATGIHWPKVWASKGGYELAVTNLAAALVLGVSGPGAYSVDTLLGVAMPEAPVMGLGLVLVIVGALLAFATRRAPAAAASSGQAAQAA